MCGALVNQSNSQDGRHLYIVRNIQLCGGWWQKGRHMNTQNPGGGKVHCSSSVKRCHSIYSVIFGIILIFTPDHT